MKLKVCLKETSLEHTIDLFEKEFTLLPNSSDDDIYYTMVGDDEDVCYLIEQLRSSPLVAYVEVSKSFTNHNSISIVFYKDSTSIDVTVEEYPDDMEDPYYVITSDYFNRFNIYTMKQTNCSVSNYTRKYSMLLGPKYIERLTPTKPIYIYPYFVKDMNEFLETFHMSLSKS